MKITIKDIAKIAGVSHSTVSRALNDSSQVSKKTRDRIKKIADEMNFEFNAGARSLKSKSTGNIALVYDIAQDRFGASLYINQLFTELRRSLTKLDMDTILVEGYNPDSGESNVLRLIRQQKVDGFLIINDKIRRSEYQKIIESGLPVIQVHMNPLFFDPNEINTYVTNNRVGGYLATKHLLDRGCKNIVTVYPGELRAIEYRDRTEGYKDALEEADIEINESLMISMESSYSGGAMVMDVIQDRGVDGIFFQTDIQAFGFLNRANMEGLKIPESIKIVGYDDIPLAQSSWPSLTTIHQPKEIIAKEVCNRLSKLLNSEVEGNCNLSIEPELIIRKTT